MPSFQGRLFGAGGDDAVWNTSAPVRDELFSAERLEMHARSLAAAQGAGRRSAGRPLSRRLAENEAILLTAHRDTLSALDEGAAITPATEWLVDNFHLIERQIREIRLDLPAGYYRELPKIVSGPLVGYPRVFGITWAFVAHTDSHFDQNLLFRFLRAYQEVQPLAIGELWAVAITLRIVLVENLRRVAELVTASRRARRDADQCADRIVGAAGLEPMPLEQALLKHARTPLKDAFVVQFCQRLRDQDAAMGPCLTWLDERLAGQGTTADLIVRDEQHRQVAASVTARNVVTSLRLISDVDWSELVERMSLVDDILRAGSGFADMDFPTRNLYRNAIEELARGSGLDELSIARRAVLAAREAEGAATDPRRADPGYHLLAGGRDRFERSLGFRSTPRTWPGRVIRSTGIGGYVATIGFTALLLLGVPIALLASLGLNIGWLVALALLGMLPAVDAAVALVNRGVTRGFRARPLPALELPSGVPSKLRTVVAVPVLLSELEGLREQIERLEIHHLSCPEGHLHFALLSDWRDAPEASTATDTELLQAAVDGITRLNQKYGPAPGGDRFLLLHRRRVWSESEGCWLGWERKRGKLHELNLLLRGARDTTFIDPHRHALPKGVRYVVTLDADTKLPRDTVRRLIGKMAHPLNQPRFDPALRRVVEGYAVLQPRITPAFPRGGGTLFHRVFSSSGGIDPYASAVSDVYQDLFGEGSFAGKGIYEIDAFEAALHGRVPESTLLSHDLFEGVFARAGLASDVEVVEEFPERYDVSAVRHHRWARGDWQLLPWILGLSAESGPAGRAPPIGRWKMLDNLRRSVSPAANLASLATGWTLPLEAAAVWTGFLLLCFALPPIIPVVASISARKADIPWQVRALRLRSDLRLALLQSSLIVIFLAHQTWLMGDAIFRTLWNLVSRRHLLQWIPAAQASAALRLGMGRFYAQMAAAPAIGVLTIGLAWALDLGGLALATPFAVLWIISPAVALSISRSMRPADRTAPSEAEALQLRLIARRTWRFFETFVTSEDHVLPPDNFQEEPRALAHRTSPTNLGLYLLSVVAARDFGWIGSVEAIERLEATLKTMEGMARHRGHFFNWYDTRSLRPMDPQYVSSVDSGNLAGHLITVANTLKEWSRPPPLGLQLAGVADALEFVRQEAQALRASGAGGSQKGQRVDEAISSLAAELGSKSPDADPRWLDILAAKARTVVTAARAMAGKAGPVPEDLVFWSEAVGRAITSHRRDLDPEPACSDRLTALEHSARGMALGMDFGFLLDRERMLLSIGCRVAEGELDSSCYDLLGSEARLASFISIAKGDAPPKHWFRLGHAVTAVAEGGVLTSWSGSMFEYLMPSLIMRAPYGSLLAQTDRLVVRRQVEHASSLGVPWGMSESAYNARDLEFTYQYRSFGVPSLGLKRGLADNVVIAPYATALAAMVDARAAVRNFDRLTAAGAYGRYGYYEALDYTPERVPEGQAHALVRAFMAHHQGMTIVALANALFGNVMQARFHAEPIIQATELLLEERMPREVALSRPWAAHKQPASKPTEPDTLGIRRISSPYGPVPATQLLSNGRYSVMLTAAGSGYSRWRDIAITRWREDSTRDDHGSYIFLKDFHTGDVWSAGCQPCPGVAEGYRATFSEDRCEIVRRDASLTTTLEVLVSAEDDAEVRRVSVSNNGATACDVEITSYAELVLTTQAADVAHPAFSKLFVQTEHLLGMGAILATRRRRSASDPEVWAGQIAVVEGELVGKPEFESDRALFVGRGRDVHSPAAIVANPPLSGTTGAVLDPIFALRRRVRIQPGATARIAFWTAVAPTRSALIDLLDKHYDATAFDRAADLAWTQALVQLHHLGIDRAEAGLFQRLAGRLIHGGGGLRPPSPVLERAAEGQPGLWRVGISGDLPIVLLRIDDIHDLAVARQLVAASEYWRTKQLAFDLVILNERSASYVQELQVALEALVRGSQSRPPSVDHTPPGRTIVLRADLVAPEIPNLVAASARIVLTARAGGVGEHLDRLSDIKIFPRSVPPVATLTAPTAAPLPDLEFFNGLGGFADDGREYVTILGPGQTTPAPWVNVVANPGFGFQVSAEGAGCSWSQNSREHQLTPWSNDPVSDPAGEALYLCDEESGAIWSPTASPIRNPQGTYVARHGRGYSRFQHSAQGIDADLIQFVPVADPIKVSRLALYNTSDRSRRISVTAYVEWVLGASRGACAPFTVTRRDETTGALFARNPWNPSFGTPVAFADLGGRQTGWTCDRREFIGRNGTLTCPAALAGAAALSERAGGGLDPCAALRTVIDLPPDGRCEVVFFLGEARNEQAARALLRRYRKANLDTVFAEVGRQWEDVLDSVQVKTPDRSMDIMLNGWLLYQTLACRLWARAGFYQASGAYGFRDQLQDCMALASVQPTLTRGHLLRAAGRQFAEGDVQHWWLPHTGQGVRTRISDDRIWLAHAAAHYVETTGDGAVLDETVHFLTGQVLESGEAESFFQPGVSKDGASLYEHCARGLDSSMELGGHGLPLIGGGDWNDGMNRVGERGLGESVWLGWFLHAALTAFIPLAVARREPTRVNSWRAHAVALQASLERNAWDGGWYRRGWFDDGSPLGSAMSSECRIDSIAQSWAVLSGVAPPERAAMAMAAVERNLILDDEELALLFAPPFDQTDLDAGYIKAYPPGIRENGGQYSHAAAWTVMAFADLGEGDKAVALFDMLNPINHSRTPSQARRYGVEPYVMAADVYAAPGRRGRGGWTWYTGSAGLMQRAGLESVLGIRRRGRFLTFDPCIPAAWAGFGATIRFGASRYEIVVENPERVMTGVVSADLGGRELDLQPVTVEMVDDGRACRIRIRLGSSTAVARSEAEKQSAVHI